MFIIGGNLKNRRLITPKGDQTRPSASRLREALFNICQNTIEGSIFLDLFAGSGAIGFEALSRGAASVIFVDSNKEAIRCVKENAKQLGVSSYCTILFGDVFIHLTKLFNELKTFDIIFCDPPYRTIPLNSISKDFYSSTLVDWFDRHSSILNSDGSLFLEEDFKSQPKLENLFSLSLFDSRRFGDTALQNYKRGVFNKNS